MAAALETEPVASQRVLDRAPLRRAYRRQPRPLHLEGRGLRRQLVRDGNRFFGRVEADGQVTFDLYPNDFGSLGERGERPAGRRDLAIEAYAESVYPRRLGWSPLRVWRDDRYKVIDAPRPELYDLERDPFELQTSAPRSLRWPTR